LDLEAKLFELPTDQDLVFYCRSGSRSMVAASLAVEAEVTGKEVYHLDGGLLSWYGKTLTTAPKVRIFDRSAGLAQMLLKAMDLEKGAWRFYDFVARRFAAEPYGKTFAALTKAETAHARTIYGFWQTGQTDPQPFERLFENLGGEILEGGEPLADALGRMDAIADNTCLNLIELALDIEFAAFDLYRTLADQENDADIRQAFLTIAQAEKAHMRTLTRAIDQCGPR
jgi:rubrerythrin